MSKLVAIVFQEIDTRDLNLEHLGAGRPADVVEPKPETALANWRTIREAAEKGGVELEDAVIVWKAGLGETKIIQQKEITPGKGARRGAFWGLLVGLVFGGPLAGVLWGLGIGAVYGKVVDHGIDNTFLADVSKALTPRSSAILMLIKMEDYAGAIEYLRSFDAPIYEADVSDGAVEAIREVAKNEQIAAATLAQFGDEGE